jgi:hypothetical protein
MHEAESCKKNVTEQSTFLKIKVFWDVTQCQLVNSDQHSKEHLTLKIKTICSFKTMVTVYQLKVSNINNAVRTQNPGFNL